MILRLSAGHWRFYLFAAPAWPPVRFHWWTEPYGWNHLNQAMTPVMQRRAVRRVVVLGLALQWSRPDRSD
jgi:hypothetical protein